MSVLTYGRHSQNRLDETRDKTRNGAYAALETFYYAFNARDIDVFNELWPEQPIPQANNPLGGILRGKEAIVGLYRRIFAAPARVWVEFGDALEYFGDDIAIFAGREQGEYRAGDGRVPLNIRTTRVFQYLPDRGWRHIHHHGSIDDAPALEQYQKVVKGQ